MNILAKYLLVIAIFFSFANIEIAQDDSRPIRVVSKQYIENAISNYSKKIAENSL